MLRALLIDDHALVRAGYRFLLQDSGEIEVVAEASTAASGYRRFLRGGVDVTVLDKLTYSGNLESLREVEGSANHRFHQADICDQERIAAILAGAEGPAELRAAYVEFLLARVSGGRSWLPVTGAA